MEQQELPCREMKINPSINQQQQKEMGQQELRR